MKWRLETYSGLKAESITARDLWRFAWNERHQLLHFLAWTDEMRGYANASARQQEIG
ncbi:MAG TPA: hypothetical protein VNU94_01980 [Acidobacteriaceae bacterium]|nr:hypothetical protein [Acidobacteriaceae bacterium]